MQYQIKQSISVLFKMANALALALICQKNERTPARAHLLNKRTCFLSRSLVKKRRSLVKERRSFWRFFCIYTEIFVKIFLPCMIIDLLDIITVRSIQSMFEIPKTIQNLKKNMEFKKFSRPKTDKNER